MHRFTLNEGSGWERMALKEQTTKALYSIPGTRREYDLSLDIEI